MSFESNDSCGLLCMEWKDTIHHPPLHILCELSQNILWECFVCIAVAIILFAIYFGWIKPMNLQLDLSATGFNHLKDGTYRSVEHGTKSFEKLVKISQRRRKLGDMPPVYPNGWFALLESDDLPLGEVRHIAALGENFAVFRTLDGEVNILNAYCPHLGANMAIGGTVQGNCLECPFHKWRFSGRTGACTFVPYSSGPPPAAKVKRWTALEVNHFVFVWYHAENASPDWSIQGRSEIESGKWSFHGRTDIMISCHIQEIQENGADIGHLDAIHGPNIMAGVDVRFSQRFMYQFLRHLWHAKWEACQEEKHKGIMTLCSQLLVLGKINVTQVTAHVEQMGPSYVELELKAVWGRMLLVMAVTPVEGLLQRVIHRMYAPILIRPFARGLLYIETIMFQRDVMMWNHKKYESKPHLVKEDRLILRHRRWYSQFYTEHSPRFSSFKDTLDW